MPTRCGHPTKKVMSNHREGAKRATKLVISLKSFSYTNRLVHLGLPTLKYRRLRGDMTDQ